MRISPPKLSSIKTKLALIVLAGVVSAMLLTALVTGWQAADRRFHGLKDELHSVASTLAIAVAPSQSEGAHHDVQNILRAIGRMPKVKFARVLDMQGDLIASFGNGVMLQSDANIAEADDEPGLLTLLTMQTYPVNVPVIQGGVVVGRLFLIADVSELRSVLGDSLGLAVVWSLFAAITGLLVALRLEKSLTGPILDLTTAMRDIRKDHDFTTRVDRKSNDETGDLVDAFNDMLNEIRTRDAALARQRETLEQTVDERTRDLRAATIAAQEANAAKSDFLATMSHEIRTPMNGMLVMAELLTAAGMPTRIQRYADVIVSSGKSLLSIINDILDFSKIEAGRMELEAVPVEPRRLVDEVTRLFAERASSKGLDLAGFVADDVPSVIAADPVRLNQILSNLVNNALKFTESGGVGVRVCLASDVAATAGAGEPVSAIALRFEVTDTGIGIPEDKVATIFEAFAQADQSTTRMFGGTGIGLAICQRLSHAMDGSIEVSSTFGAGSTFALRAGFEVLEEAPDLASLAGHDDQARLALHIAMPPSPTRNALVDYARYYGYDPILCDQSNTTEIDCLAAQAAPAAPAIVISRCCDLLKKLRSANGELKLVQLAGFGQSCSQTGLGSSHADTAISWPLATDEISELFAALRTGNLGLLRSHDSEPSRNPAIASFEGVRVLAADDSAINREVLGEALGRLGVEVVNVENGAEAIETFTSQTFNVVFMDGSMPQMDGFEATRRIRAWEAAKNRSATPIIALTAHVIGSQANLWRDAGMNDCVTKPFTIAMLEKTLRTWLPDHEAAAAVDAAAAIPPGIGTPSATSENGNRTGSGIADAGAVQPAAGGALAAVAVAARAQMRFPLLDPEVLDQIREMPSGDMDLAAKVIALYRDHAPEALRSLRDSWPEATDEAIATAAHALKSLSRNIGAVRIAEICEVVESGARDSSLDRASPLMQDLETALEATLAALPAVTAQPDATAAA
ncbi:MAG: hypothetical protein APF80_01465 [Alphaproteobacteria bacterium BRH_c36]|nr:MAG: hypothetical protein APF80_01465 [Alphaproteobacteria bacterium BRH_c36]